MYGNTYQSGKYGYSVPSTYPTSACYIYGSGGYYGYIVKAETRDITFTVPAGGVGLTFGFGNFRYFLLMLGAEFFLFGAEGFNFNISIHID